MHDDSYRALGLLFQAEVDNLVLGPGGYSVRTLDPDVAPILSLAGWVELADEDGYAGRMSGYRLTHAGRRAYAEERDRRRAAKAAA